MIKQNLKNFKNKKNFCFLPLQKKNRKETNLSGKKRNCCNVLPLSANHSFPWHSHLVIDLQILDLFPQFHEPSFSL
jgi:hypothetical protein